MEALKQHLPNFRGIPNTKVYRASRPDQLEGESLEAFMNLGIKSIIDLRSMREFPSAKGPKAVDDHFKLFSVNIEKANSVVRSSINKNGKVNSTEKFDLESYAGYSENDERTHSVFDMVSREYAAGVMSRASFGVKGFLYSLYAIDHVFQSSMFIKALVQYCINSRGLLGQYQDIIDYCGDKIRVVLQTMSCASQAPVLVNCTYGKDRTGIIMALVLAVLGKSPDFIADDYAKSAPELANRAEVQGYLQQMRFNDSFYKSDRETMVKLLEYVDEKYGSVEKYLEHIGFVDSWQRQLRAALLLDELADPQSEVSEIPQ